MNDGLYDPSSENCNILYDKIAELTVKIKQNRKTKKKRIPKNLHSNTKISSLITFSDEKLNISILKHDIAFKRQKW